MKTNLFLREPAPNFAELERVIRGAQKPQRVHLAELLIDAEVMQSLAEDCFGVPWAPVDRNDRANEELFYKQRIDLFYRLGYDSVNLSPGMAQSP